MTSFADYSNQVERRPRDEPGGEGVLDGLSWGELCVCLLGEDQRYKGGGWEPGGRGWIAGCWVRRVSEWANCRIREGRRRASARLPVYGNMTVWDMHGREDRVWDGGIGVVGEESVAGSGSVCGDEGRCVVYTHAATVL